MEGAELSNDLKVEDQLEIQKFNRKKIRETFAINLVPKTLN
jgi:hypothetical protein